MYKILKTEWLKISMFTVIIAGALLFNLKQFPEPAVLTCESLVSLSGVPGGTLSISNIPTSTCA